MIRLWLLAVLLSLGAWAQGPEAVVRRVYTVHRQTDDPRRTLQRCATCFSPTFRALLQRALAARTPVLDSDPFTDSQAGWYGFDVKPGRWDGQHAVVPVNVYSGRWPQVNNPQDMGEVRREVPPHPARYYLVQLSGGYQIYDIEFLPSSYRVQGKLTRTPGYRLRPRLRQLLGGRG